MIAELKEAYACHDIDDDGIEYFLFKMVDKDTLEKVFLAILNQRVMDKFIIRSKEEIYRTGYINTGFRVELINIDYGIISLDDIKRMITEMMFAAGYELFYIKHNKILNLKAIYK